MKYTVEVFTLCMYYFVMGVLSIMIMWTIHFRDELSDTMDTPLDDAACCSYSRDDKVPGHYRL